MPQFITPVAGRLTQPFKAGVHEGVDIGAPDHSTVVASESGRVTFEGIWGAGGNTLIITGNDGWKTYYCHLAKFIVSMGASVTQGQAIAQSGGALGEQGAGNATGAHLHFEIHTPNGNAIDPQTYISVGGAPLMEIPLGNETGIVGAVDNGLNKAAGSVLTPALAPLNNSVGAAKTVLNWSTGAGKALTFLTDSSNWKRIGLFAAGAALLGVVVVKTLGQSDTLKSVAGVAAKAA